MKSLIFKFFLSSIFLFLGVIIFEIFFLLQNKTRPLIEINDNDKNYSLYQTDYYTKGGIKDDPYNDFVSLQVHPYYYFGFPWLKEEIERVNNEFVNLDEYGFRISNRYKDKLRNIILLGGSTAFGHFASSDKTTITSLISNYSKFNAINRGVPNWNSYQEALSLYKYDKKFHISISLSASNDYQIYCSNDFNKTFFADTPEFFPLIIESFNNIRASNTLTFTETVKKYIEIYFPNMTEFYVSINNQKRSTNINKNEIVKEDDLINYKKKEKEEENFVFCGGKESIDKLVEKFLSNQKRMRLFAKGNNAQHWLVIQPMYRFHKNTINSKDQQAKKYFLDQIVNSEFCKINCLNYVNIFDDYTNEILKLKSDRADIDWPQKSFFVDNFHLTDLGTKILVEKLIMDLNLD